MTFLPSFKTVLVSKQSAVLPTNLEQQRNYIEHSYTLANTVLDASNLLHAHHGLSRVDVP